MTTRNHVVEEARRWLGTPFQHQGHSLGLACDCAGLIRGVAMRLKLVSADFMSSEAALPFLGYPTDPYQGLMERACHAFMLPISIDSAKAGDVVLMKWKGDPRHLAILVPYAIGGLAMIHAYNRATPPSVVEHRFSDVWRARVVEAFALPGVA